VTVVGTDPGHRPLASGRARNVANAQAITTQTAVRCVVKGAPVVDVKLRAKGVADFYVHTGKTMIATAHATPNSVTLIVPKNCRLFAPPHP
jgi:hypothetical protein